jgi:hypothetical protein
MLRLRCTFAYSESEIIRLPNLITSSEKTYCDFPQAEFLIIVPIVQYIYIYIYIYIHVYVRHVVQSNVFFCI